MSKELFHIYDRIFKRIFALSNLALIGLINALFHTDYPPGSTITYPSREFVNRFLKNRLADVVLIINGSGIYHLEAQMYKDRDIVLRIFEIGFNYAVEHREDETYLRFPQPVVIYLSKESNIPAESVITLDFGEQGSYEYKVKNFVYLDHDIKEINQKKMIILIPFQLLKLKEIIQKKPTRENFLKLQTLLTNDILDSIDANLKVGNITLEDANQLVELTQELYRHLFEHYYEIGGCEDMKPLLEGALELPMDKYRIRIDELEKAIELEKAKAEQKQAALAQEKSRAEEEKAALAQEKSIAEKEKAALAQEVEALKQRIKELTN